MPNEVRLWRIGPDDNLSEIQRASLDLEARLQEWLARDISILDPGLLVIDREVETDFGGYIDLLCIDAIGDLVVVELKRDRTPREITESAKKCGAIRQRMPRSRVSCPVHGSGGTLLTLANCLSTTVSITLSTIPVEAPDCYSGVGWPSVDHVAIYPHESGTAPHFLALPTDRLIQADTMQEVPSA